MRPSQTILVLEALRDSFGGPLFRKGIELSLNDRQTVLDVYQQWLALTIDLGYLSYESLERDAHRLFSDMVNKDVLDLNNAFAELLHCVRMQNFRGFKALCRRISDHLYYLIRGDMSRSSSGDVFSAKRLVQLFAFTSRLTLRDIDLTQQCLEDYLGIENNISDPVDSPLVPALNTIIKRWMKSFDPTRLRFQHGPGGVAGHGRTALEVKYKDLTFDARTSYAFGDPWWSVSQIRSSLDRVSQTIFVPKSYKTFRTISMEPSTLQYLQQGVWREIDRVVSHSPYLRSHIGFHEQERNQRLAKEGSLNRNFATIDLSSASDSVSYALVKKLFRGTKLLRFLIATRSPRTLLPDGRLVDLKKFAPMGSSLCFPIETIIFASICAYVTRSHGVSGQFSVFGDDIIVPTQCVGQTMTILETLGFYVNREKSFYHEDCWFRESCGSEFCDGYDVSPMRISRKYNHRQRLVQMTGLIDLANEAFSRNFRHLRHFYLLKLRQARFSPLFSDDELLGDSYSNFHVRRRWNSNWQRIECEVTTLATQFSSDQDESIRLRHWIESTADRSTIGDGFQSDVGHSTVTTRNRWRAKPYESFDQEFIDWCLAESK